MSVKETPLGNEPERGASPHYNKKPPHCSLETTGRGLPYYNTKTSDTFAMEPTEPHIGGITLPDNNTKAPEGAVCADTGIGTCRPYYTGKSK